MSDEAVTRDAYASKNGILKKICRYVSDLIMSAQNAVIKEIIDVSC